MGIIMDKILLWMDKMVYWMDGIMAYFISVNFLLPVVSAGPLLVSAG